jgi:hypothetical protein
MRGSNFEKRVSRLGKNFSKDEGEGKLAQFSQHILAP